MGIAYVGNCEFEESADFAIGKNEFGAHTLTRTYEGRTDKLDAFLTKWPKGKPDRLKPVFKTRALQVTGRGAFSSVTISSVGLIDSRIPEEEVQGGWRLQTASLKRNGSEEVTEIEYRAPVTSYRYVSLKEPQEQRFPRMVRLTKMAWQFNQQYGDRTTKFHQVIELGRIGGLPQYTQTKLGFFNYARDIMTSVFTWEQVGDLYLVTEENEGRILEIARNDLPRFLQPDHWADLAIQQQEAAASG